MGDYRTIAEVKAIPPERQALAKAALVETALAFCLLSPGHALARAAMVERMATVLPDLAGLTEGGAFAVRMAAEAVVESWGGTALDDTPVKVERLKLALAMLFIDRADLSIGRWKAR